MTDNSKAALDKVIEAGRLAFKEKGTVAAVAEAMAAPYHVDTARTEAIPFPEVPKPITLTEEVKKALRNLGKVFAVVQPDKRRTLTDVEKQEIHEERETIAAIIGLLKKRDEDLKTIVRTHMDVDAEERGVAVPKAVVDPVSGTVIVEATDRSRDGHYILCGPGNPEVVSIPGTGMEWQRQYSKGKMTTDPSVLDEMLEDGSLSRPAYLAMTREVRVYSDDKARAALNNKAVAEEVYEAIRRMVSYGKPTVSLYTRKAK